MEKTMNLYITIGTILYFLLIIVYLGYGLHLLDEMWKIINRKKRKEIYGEEDENT